MDRKPIINTLKQLNTVDRGGFRHAYGSAIDVPKQLRALKSRRQKIREQAYSDLYSNIWHQGTVYSVTPHVVPFLLGLLEEEKTPDKGKLLEYLGALAWGS